MFGYTNVSEISLELKSHSNRSLFTAFTCGTFLLASPGEAAIIASLEQVGPDGVATWRGDITLGPYSASMSSRQGPTIASGDSP